MIHWTASSKKKTRRGREGSDPREFRKPVDQARARAEMNKFFARRAGTWADGEPKADATCRALMQRVHATLSGSDWIPESVDVEAARAAMLGDYDSTGKDLLTEYLIPLWVATKGARFATEALVNAATMERQWHVRVNQEPGWYVARGSAELGVKHRPLTGWGGLRAELAFVSAEEYRSEHATLWLRKKQIPKNLNL
jgi:hypothetical protein